MFKQSAKSGLVLGGAAVLVLAMAACSSSATTTAAKTSATSPAAPSGLATTPSASDTSSSDAAASASSSASASDTDVASAPSATPPAVTNKLTDWVERSGFKVKIDVVTYPYLPPASDSFQPDSNQEFLRLHLELANIGGAGAFPMLGLEVRDSADASILPDVVVTDSLPAGQKLDLLNLKPGEKQTGDVVFTAPKGDKGLRLVVKGTVMTADGTQVDTSAPPVIDLGV